MPHLTISATIFAAGPIIDAEVALDACGLRQVGGSGSAEGKPMPLKLLIDTGSARTLLAEELFRPSWLLARRNLGPVALGIGAGVPTYEYDLDFAMGGPGVQKPWRIATTTVTAGANWRRSVAYDGLLGRDLLAHIDSFEYRGKKNRLALHY